MPNTQLQTKENKCLGRHFPENMSNISDADEAAGRCWVEKKLTVPKGPHLETLQRYGERCYSCSRKAREVPKLKSRKWLHGRKLTVPKGPRLISSEKYGERNYSCCGLKNSSESCLPGHLHVYPQQTVSFNNDKRVTIPTPPRLGTLEKHGDKYYSCASQSRCTVKVDSPRRIQSALNVTVPKAPRLKTMEKYGERCYSCYRSRRRKVDLQKEIWKSCTGTIPKAPRLETFERCGERHYSLSKFHGTEDEEDSADVQIRSNMLIPHEIILKDPRVKKRSNYDYKPTVPCPFSFQMSEIVPRRSPLRYGDEEASMISQTQFKALPMPDLSFTQPHFGFANRPKALSLANFDEYIEQCYSCCDTEVDVESTPFNELRSRVIQNLRLHTSDNYDSRTTVSDPFSFQTSERATKRLQMKNREKDSSSVNQTQFKALPMPNFSFKQPKFGFSTSASPDRYIELCYPCGDREDKVKPYISREFKYRDSASYGSRTTVPIPFSFQTSERAAKRQTRRVGEDSSSVNQNQFKARPMPDLSHRSPQSGSHSVGSNTTPKPFHFQYMQRAGNVESPVRSSNRAKYLSPEKRSQFKARPMPNLSDRPSRVVKRSTLRHGEEEASMISQSRFKALPMPKFSFKLPQSGLLNDQLISPSTNFDEYIELCYPCYDDEVDVVDTPFNELRSRVIQDLRVYTSDNYDSETTVPIPFSFQTSERAAKRQTRRVGEDKTRPMPDLSHRSPQSGSHSVGSNTTPKPFHFQYMQRAGNVESPVRSSNRAKYLSPEKRSQFKARPMPNLSDRPPRVVKRSTLRHGEEEASISSSSQLLSQVDSEDNLKSDSSINIDDLEGKFKNLWQKSNKALEQVSISSRDNDKGSCPLNSLLEDKENVRSFESMVKIWRESTTVTQSNKESLEQSDPNEVSVVHIFPDRDESIERSDSNEVSVAHIFPDGDEVIGGEKCGVYGGIIESSLKDKNEEMVAEKNIATSLEKKCTPEAYMESEAMVRTRNIDIKLGDAKVKLKSEIKISESEHSTIYNGTDEYTNKITEVDTFDRQKSKVQIVKQAGTMSEALVVDTEKPMSAGINGSGMHEPDAKTNIAKKVPVFASNNIDNKYYSQEKGEHKMYQINTGRHLTTNDKKKVTSTSRCHNGDVEESNRKSPRFYPSYNICESTYSDSTKDTNRFREGWHWAQERQGVPRSNTAKFRGGWFWANQQQDISSHQTQKKALSTTLATTSRATCNRKCLKELFDGQASCKDNRNSSPFYEYRGFQQHSQKRNASYPNLSGLNRPCIKKREFSFSTIKSAETETDENECIILDMTNIQDDKPQECQHSISRRECERISHVPILINTVSPIGGHHNEKSPCSKEKLMRLLDDNVKLREKPLKEASKDNGILGKEQSLLSNAHSNTHALNHISPKFVMDVHKLDSRSEHNTIFHERTLNSDGIRENEEKFSQNSNSFQKEHMILTPRASKIIRPKISSPTIHISEPFSHHDSTMSPNRSALSLNVDSSQSSVPQAAIVNKTIATEIKGKSKENIFLQAEKTRALAKKVSNNMQYKAKRPNAVGNTLNIYEESEKRLLRTILPNQLDKVNYEIEPDEYNSHCVIDMQDSFNSLFSCETKYESHASS